MSDPQPVQFTRQSAERIAAVVRQQELTPARASPLEFDGALVSARKETLRLGRITGEWHVGVTKQVTQINLDGSPMEPPVTFEAINRLQTVTNACGEQEGTTTVVCGLIRGQWTLVAFQPACRDGGLRADYISPTSASCTSNSDQLVSGPDSQVLLNENGCVKWVGLVRRDVVIGVSFEEGVINCTTKPVYLFDSSSSPVTIQIIETQECPSA